MRKVGERAGAPAVLVEPIYPPKESLAGLCVEEESALAEDDPWLGAELSSSSLDLGEDEMVEEPHTPSSLPLPAIRTLPARMKV